MMPSPAPAPAAAPSPLHLTMRFSASIPDLDLDVPSPHLTSVLALKHLLRGRLSTRSRLRLIHQGRLLPDTAALAAVLRPLPPPPASIASAPSSSSSSSPASHAPAKAKGKAVDVGPTPPPLRIYVNCSIGDELSPADLAAEAAAARDPPVALGPRGVHSRAGAVPPSTPSSATARPPNSSPPSSTPPATAAWRHRPRPRGFDRLLQAGFTASEIATLRTQFASINAERFAPDAMPSPDSLRALEDAWIDSNAGEVPAAAGAGASLDDDAATMSTVLDILTRGMMIGFFFPLGSLTWLLRQGLWSSKWQIFVGSGVVLSLTVGIVMGISGDH